MNFSVQLSENTLSPNHVPKDVESGVQCEKFFRNPTADRHCRAACSRPLKSVPVEQTRRLRECPWSPHTREYPSVHEENTPCRANKGKASVQDITFSHNGYGTHWHFDLLCHYLSHFLSVSQFCFITLVDSLFNLIL